jgi:hypothetical protein
MEIPVTVVSHPVFPTFIYIETKENKLIGYNKLLGNTLIELDTNKINDFSFNKDITEESHIVNLDGIKGDNISDPYDRKIINSELEKILDKPFEIYDLYTGDKRRNSLRESGKVKLQINNTKQKIINEKVCVRLYILTAENLNPFDKDTATADPYLIISCGDTIINDKKDTKFKTLNPDFYKCYEFYANVINSVNIKVCDADLITNDDYIGETVIDLEDRFYSSKWKHMENKPIEKRTLWNIDTELAQGTINLWVDIIPVDKVSTIPKLQLVPRDPLDCELRLIIWNTSDVKFKDKNMSDIFVSAILAETNEEQHTDIHWRSMNGTGAFNWRMIFDVRLPGRYPRLKLQLWDKDILDRNDSIAEATINLKDIFKNIYYGNKKIYRVPKQWINLVNYNDNSRVYGSIELSLEILTKVEASRYPVGLGRNGPDALPYPYRPSSSFNPFRIDKYIIESMWEKQKSKIYLTSTICCIVIGLIVVVYLFS